MSYILDALKKSERERSLGAVPTLETVHDFSTTPRKRPGFRILALALVILFALLGAGIYGAMFWEAREIAGSDTNNAESLPVEPREPPVQHVQAAPPSEVTLEAPTVRDDVPEVVPQVADPRPAAKPAAAAPAAKNYPLLGELSDETRGRLSDIVVNVVSYSENPRRRFIMVNQKIYREGTTINSDVSVVEIRPEGAVMRYRGREFLVTP